MAKRFDFIFGVKIDDKSRESELKKIQSQFKQQNLSITPVINDDAIKQLQKNLKETYNEATKVKTLTSSFTQDNIKYNVEQTQKSNGRGYGNLNVTADYSKEIDRIETSLKRLYSEAIQNQELLNNTIKTGVTTYSKDYKAAVQNAEAQIKDLNEELSRIYNPQDSSLLSKYSNRLTRTKTEGSELQEVKDLEKVQTIVTSLTDAYIKLDKAKSKGEGEASINAQQALVDSYEQEIQAILSASTATDGLRQKTEALLKEQQLLRESRAAINEEKQSDKNYEKYLSTLRSITRQEKDLAKLQSESATASKEKKQEIDNAIDVLRKNITADKQHLDVIEQSLKGTKNYNNALEAREKSERDVAFSTAKLNANQKESVSLLQSLKNATKDYFEGFIKYQLVGNIFNILEDGMREAISTIQELDKAMTDVRLVTGGTAEETAELAEQYNQIAKSMGATTAEVASGASEWFNYYVKTTINLLNCGEPLRGLITKV